MSTARPILIAEDDDALRQALVDCLATSGEWQPVEAAALGEAGRRLGPVQARFDAVVLDADAPDGDGRDFCAQMRRQGHAMPVIMLTDMPEEAGGVRGLEAGASDYVSKPVHTHELPTRLRAQLRLFDNSADAVFTVGPYTFHPSARVLLKPKKHQRIRLTSKEAAILGSLCRAGRRGVLRETLIAEVWGRNVGVTKHALDTHIYRLRQALEADPADRRLLIAMPGGYRLDGAFNTQVGNASAAATGCRGGRCETRATLPAAGGLGSGVAATGGPV